MKEPIETPLMDFGVPDDSPTEAFLEERLPRLTELWGRRPDACLKLGGSYPLMILRFPPVEEKVPGGADLVYMTLGLAQYALKVEKEDAPIRIELTAFAPSRYHQRLEAFTILNILAWIAQQTVAGKTVPEFGEFFSWPEEALVPESEMTTLYFAGFPDARDSLEDTRDQLLKALEGPQDVLNLIPVSGSECGYANSHGMWEFHELMRTKGVDASFDLTRDSVY